MEQSAIGGLELSPENPVWTFGDVVIITLAFVAFLFIFAIGTVLVAVLLPAFRGLSSQEIAQNLTIALIAQLFAYIAVIATIFAVIRRRAEHVNRYLNVQSALRWNPPKNALAFFGLGIMLAALMQLTGRFLPVPPSLPIDQAFTTMSSAYMMMFFGIAIAPLFEEIYFRGLFYPVVVRAFRHSGTVFATTAAVVITGAFFAAIHGQQVGYSWAPLVVIFFVGMVLTLVRARTRSLAASWFVHVGYNTTLMVLVFVQTGGFRHLEVLR